MSRHINNPSLEIILLSSPDWNEYELLDCGGGHKLERFGPYHLVRPEPDAIWEPALSRKRWKAVDAIFKSSAEKNGGHWEYLKEIPKRWVMEYKGLRFWVQTSASRHIGVFPEQAAQWDWIGARIRAASYPLKVLNLFGYTGLATLVAAWAGARVTHIDASRKAVTWARENQQISELSDRPIRWLVDDVLKFVRREERRNVKYDGLILDPPKFGRGPKGEVWEFYKLIPALLNACRKIMSPRPNFVVLTAYAVKASSLTLGYALQEMMNSWKGTTTAGELVINEQSAGRILSTAIFSRWASSELR